MPDFAHVLARCEDIVRQSGSIVREHWARPSEVRHKGRVDLVTQTDAAVEAFLRERLAALLPEAGCLAEESSGPDQRPSGLCWIIDPVDGTTNFVHRIPQVGTSVALWNEDHVALGVVNVPLLDECYSALRGGGAWRGGTRLSVSQAAGLDDALAATGFPYELGGGRLDSVLGRLSRVLPRTQGLRRIGAASVDLAYVACGRLDVFYEEWLKPWDLAAGWLLVEEAGGRVTNLRGESFQFGDALLASNGHVHAAMTALLGPTED